MATRALAAAALAAMLALGAGCSDDGGSRDAAEPTTVAFEEVGLAIEVPAGLSDLTYAMGESEEGQPALYFSTEKLEHTGGSPCAAGATAAVSPYPLGQVVVSEETPEHVKEEARENPEEDLGTFVVRAGQQYLYYIAPPDEPCRGDIDAAVALQRKQTAELRSALDTLHETE